MSDRLHVLFKRLAIAAACLFVGMYIAVALSRLRYPFELEWMEGGMLQHVHRVLQGLPLYVQPSLDFTPFIYPPMYYYVAGATTLVFPDGFTPLRLVSLLASAGCFVLIFIAVYGRTGRRAPAVLAAGLYAATFVASGTWFDIARVDSLFMFFILAGICTILRGQSTRWQLSAAALFTLAFMTKQIAPVVIAPIALALILAQGRRSLPFVAGVAVGLVVSTAVLTLTSDGWFLYYMVELPQQHASIKSVHLTFWIVDLLTPLFVATVVGTVALVSMSRRYKDTDALLLLSTVLGLFAASYLSRVHSGGYDNVLMPVHAAIAMLFGIGLPIAEDALKTWRSSYASWGIFALAAACLLQFGVLAYNPLAQVPTKEDMQAGEALMAAIQQYEGEVLIGGPGYLAERAGKKAYAHQAALVDVIRGADSAEKALLIGEMNEALSGQKFDAILQDWTVWDWATWHLPHTLHDYYEVGEQSLLGQEAYPVVGHPSRPQVVYVPRDSIN